MSFIKAHKMSMGAFLYLVVLALNVHAMDEFQKRGLKAHNEYRAQHGVPPLILNREMCKFAQEWADHLASNNLWYHRPDNIFGENLYASWNSDPTVIPTAEIAVDSWYKEIDLYDYNHPVFSRKTGHFTALVWLDTEELGMGMATSVRSGKTYVVANYNPPGNVEGLFDQNVLPLLTDFSPTQPNFPVEKFNPVLPEQSLAERGLAERGLKAHNKYRAQHGVPPLILNREMCKFAQEWADHLASNDLWYHRPQNIYGENLYASWNSDPTVIPTAEMAVDSWYKEIDLYDYKYPVFSRETGHFTALVWLDTKELGMGMATSVRSGKTYVVANYNPPGNVEGLFDKKVLPLLTDFYPTQPYYPVGKFNPVLPEQSLADRGLAERGLKAHNKYRAQHGVAPLMLNIEMCKFAQEWADHLASNDLWYHRPDNIYGENLYASWNSDPTVIPTAEMAVDSWYKEIDLYDYKYPVFSRETGHFTALIWLDTEELGMGMATSVRSGKTYVVANYNPPGNVEGLFDQNVLPLLTDFFPTQPNYPDRKVNAATACCVNFISMYLIFLLVVYLL